MTPTDHSAPSVLQPSAKPTPKPIDPQNSGFLTNSSVQDDSQSMSKASLHNKMALQQEEHGCAPAAVQTAVSSALPLFVKPEVIILGDFNRNPDSTQFGELTPTHLSLVCEPTNFGKVVLLACSQKMSLIHQSSSIY
jgi:hypothetical protein